jgi:hypothetical protein
MWPLCVPAHSLRAFMSSIMRWRNELTESVLVGNSCLGEVDDTSILKTELPARYRRRLLRLPGRQGEPRAAHRAIAQRFSAPAERFTCRDAPICRRLGAERTSAAGSGAFLERAVQVFLEERPEQVSREVNIDHRRDHRQNPYDLLGHFGT